MSEKQPKNLTVKIFYSLILGLIIGLLFKWSGDWIINLGILQFSPRLAAIDIFHIGGQIFIHSLKMMIVPLVFVSLVCGVCSLSDTSKLGRLGGKSISLYIFTTAIAVTLAISLALVVSPGEGADIPTDLSSDTKSAPPLSQVIIDMFPTNPVAAMAEGNMLQIIIFAVLFGIAIVTSGQSGTRIKSIFDDLNSINLRLVSILMNFAPYGVFCLIAKLAAEIEFAVFAKVLQYFILVFCVLVLHALVSYPLLMKLLSGLDPLIFLKKMKENAIFAFSTASSSATLPVTLATATKKLGVNNSVASFTVPLGATINMDGTAIMQGVATVFIAQAFNVDLSLSDYLMVILTATLASIGTAGVPGVGLIMLAMVLQQVNLPVEGIALIMGVDRLLDMTRTSVNITGDCMISCVVAKSEGQLDKQLFMDPTAGIDTSNG